MTSGDCMNPPEEDKPEDTEEDWYRYTNVKKIPGLRGGAQMNLNMFRSALTIIRNEIIRRNTWSWNDWKGIRQTNHLLLFGLMQNVLCVKCAKTYTGFVDVIQNEITSWHFFFLK